MNDEEEREKFILSESSISHLVEPEDIILSTESPKLRLVIVRRDPWPSAVSRGPSAFRHLRTTIQTGSRDGQYFNVLGQCIQFHFLI